MEELRTEENEALREQMIESKKEKFNECEKQILELRNNRTSFKRQIAKRENSITEINVELGYKMLRRGSLKKELEALTTKSYEEQ